jgi:hypothetical protein
LLAPDLEERGQFVNADGSGPEFVTVERTAASSAANRAMPASHTTSRSAQSEHEFPTELNLSGRADDAGDHACLGCAD